MNQKRITNQILELKNYTLNSTLNYLFNISNMKKLFSYLLISSMVVLSSCTNYDDQFDDLNTQINTLKTQIEGFSSLSSGLTALQGTVASLQTAVANIPVTPATDVSGLATAANLDALDTALTALAAEVDAIKTALAGAATSAEVATLQANLTTAQADLAELLAQNNIYAPTGGVLTVSTQSELDFALALGDKVSIINGGVNITHTSTMSDANVATLMGKMMSVTGVVTYTGTVTSTVAGEFTKLTGALNVNINQSGSISLPALVSTGALSLSGDDLTTSVSLPALTHVTSGLGALSFSKATSVDLSALTAYDSAISITTADGATVDLTAFTNANTVLGVADTSPEDLTIVNASVLTAPNYAQGKIIGNSLVNVQYPSWKFDKDSRFAKAKTVVLAGINNAKAAAYEININTIFPKATSVHLIAAASTATTPTHLDVKTGTSANLETLILGGTWDDVTIDGSDLTSLTFDGTAKDVDIQNTDLVTVDIPYTATAKGSLVVSNNADLTSFTASKVDGLFTLKVQTNPSLATLDLTALNDAGAATAAVVAIDGNDLAIESIQLAGAAPVVAHKITSADFTPLKAYLADAIGQIGTTGSVIVTADSVGKTITAAGVEDTTVEATDLIYGAAGIAGSTYAAGVIANKSYVASDAVGGVSAVREILFTGLNATDSSNQIKVGDDTVSIIPSTGLDLYYDVAAWASSASTVAALNTAGVTITGYGKGENTVNLEFVGLTNVSGVYTLGTGMGASISVTTGSASTTVEIADAVATALAAATGVASKYYSVAHTGTSDVDLTTLAKGSHKDAFSLTLDVKALSGAVASTTSLGYTAASIVLGANTPDVSSAYVTFKSNVAGVAGFKSVSFLNGTATELTASGVNTGAGNLVGDDETYTAAVNGTDQSASNAAAITAASVDFSSAL